MARADWSGPFVPSRVRLWVLADRLRPAYGPEGFVNVRSVARLLVAFAALALGFGGGLTVGLVARPAPSTRVVTTTTVEVVNGPKSAARKPAPVPTLLQGATDPQRLT